MLTAGFYPMNYSGSDGCCNTTRGQQHIGCLWVQHPCWAARMALHFCLALRWLMRQCTPSTLEDWICRLIANCITVMPGSYCQYSGALCCRQHEPSKPHCRTEKGGLGPPQQGLPTAAETLHLSKEPLVDVVVPQQRIVESKLECRNRGSAPTRTAAW